MSEEEEALADGGRLFGLVRALDESQSDFKKRIVSALEREKEKNQC